MKRKMKIIAPFVIVFSAVAAAVTYMIVNDVAVLDPKGTIAAEQRDLIYIALGLMLLVVVPVFALTFFIAWKYREGNTNAKYTPDWDHNRTLELTWWGIPLAIIVVLAIITWQSTHALDPYKPITSTKEPITIQVIALQWKWLFIYPDQRIATVNHVQFPEDTPVNFHITADAPMNSFWIPQLGGQVYAMAGMKTKLHLMADERGTFQGSSANLSGKGFSGMTFRAKATSDAEFEAWVKTARKSPHKLTQGAYNELAKPDTAVSTATYASPASGLYDTVVMKYMAPVPAQGDTQREAHGSSH